MYQSSINEQWSERNMTRSGLLVGPLADLYQGLG